LSIPLLRHLSFRRAPPDVLCKVIVRFPAAFASAPTPPQITKSPRPIFANGTLSSSDLDPNFRIGAESLRPGSLPFAPPAVPGTPPRWRFVRHFLAAESCFLDNTASPNCGGPIFLAEGVAWVVFLQVFFYPVLFLVGFPLYVLKDHNPAPSFG